MGTVDISKSKGGRFCCSYFYIYFKTQKIPGYTRDFCKSNKEAALDSSSAIFFITSERAYRMWSVLGCLWKQLSVHGIMIPYVLATFFLRKLKKDGIKFRFCC